MKVKWLNEGLEFNGRDFLRSGYNFSLPLVVILLTSALWWKGPHFNGIAVAVVVAVGFMISVLAHELGHALMARRLGATPVRIRMHAGGGAALLKGVKTRAQDRWITLAGPAVNLAIGFVCLSIFFAFAPELLHRFDPHLTASTPALAIIVFRSLVQSGRGTDKSASGLSA